MNFQAEVSDPRDPLSEHLLQVRYRATPPSPPTRDDPGYGPEYRIIECLTKRGTEARLTPAQFSTLVDRIHAQHAW